MPSSVLLSKGGGETGSVVEGATQADMDPVPLVAANCRNTSRRTGSAGQDSNGRAKRAT